jgi:hypothetical protein
VCEVCGLDSRDSGVFSLVDSFEDGNTPLDCRSGGEFLDQLSHCHLIKKGSVPLNQ